VFKNLFKATSNTSACVDELAKSVGRENIIFNCDVFHVSKHDGDNKERLLFEKTTPDNINLKSKQLID